MVAARDADMGDNANQNKSGMPGWLIALLVTLGLIVVLGAILGLLAWMGVRRYLKAAKSAEALNTVGMIGTDAATAYAADMKLCKSATQPVPVSLTAVKAKKYMSTLTDWTRDPADAGFTCLKFSMEYPQYYQYDYKLTTPTSFQASGHGDLDGNGVASEFTMNGHVVAGAVVLDPSVTQKNPEE